MNEDNTLLGGTPFISYDDAVEFLSKRTNGSCSACGHNSWQITVPVATEDEKSGVSIGLGFVNTRTGNSIQRGYPTVAAVCKKCAHIRLHGVFEISRWKASGKPEFNENE
jgi:hypothetical protein